MAWLLQFAFFYPLFMSFIWMTGGLIYFFHWEKRGEEKVDEPPELESYPPVSILIPCRNESDNVKATIGWALASDYPDFEVIAIDDGSTDNTSELLDELVAQNPQLRVIHLESNQGKAVALRMGALAARYEVLVCIDGDALLEQHALRWMVPHFMFGPRVGAVTGNPRIRNRSTLLGKIQVGEFSSIIGLIKRAQRIYGKIFTVSGVIVAFRKTALHRVGYWANDMVTEDIDVTWRLQMDGWSVRYEPNALCGILMPEKLRGLWKQRLRWAQGGVEVIRRYGFKLLRWRQRRMWGVLAEYLLSVAWAYAMVFIILAWIVGQLVQLPTGLQVDTLIPQWHGVVLGMTCLLQIAVSMIIDSRFEQGRGRHYYWMIWYPLAYWILSMLTSVAAVPKAISKPRGKRATWVSPDRGITDG